MSFQHPSQRGMGACFFTPYGTSRMPYSTGSSTTNPGTGNNSNSGNNINSGLRTCVRNATIGCTFVSSGGSASNGKNNMINCVDRHTRKCLNNH